MKENIEILKNSEAMKKAFEFLRLDDAHTLEQQLRLVGIPSYYEHEEERGKYFRLLMEEIGYHTETDEAGNVYTEIAGTGNGPTVYISAHLDTVFPEGTSLEEKWEENIIRIPGICDDTRGLAEILSMLRAIHETGLKPVGNIIIGGNVGEEGLGNLKGVRHFFKNNADKVDGFISVDGVGELICYGGTGSHRYEVTFHGVGGHSYSAFGLVNPIHAMGRAISYISEIRTPREPKTTFSVGVVSGGTSVNAIPSECKMLVDIRSDGQKELEELDAKIQKAIYRGAEDENKRWEEERSYPQEGLNRFDTEARIHVTMKQIGDRPVGNQNKDCEIVDILTESYAAMGVTPVYMSNGSTDANVPLSLGIPAVCICGGGRGGNYHSLEEWFDPTDAYLGVQRNLLALFAMTGLDGVAKPALRIRNKER